MFVLMALVLIARLRQVQWFEGKDFMMIIREQMINLVKCSAGHIGQQVKANRQNCEGATVHAYFLAFELQGPRYFRVILVLVFESAISVSISISIVLSSTVIIAVLVLLFMPAILQVCSLSAAEYVSFKIFVWQDLSVARIMFSSIAAVTQSEDSLTLFFCKPSKTWIRVDHCPGLPTGKFLNLEALSA